MFKSKNNNQNNQNENENNEKESNNSLWSWINGKAGSIAIGLAAGYALYKFGILQKLLKGVGQMFRKKDENPESSNSQSTSI